MFSPITSALIKAMKQGHLITCPDLTEDAIKNNLKMTPATAMGHMNKKRQNICSTSKEVQGKFDLEVEIVTRLAQERENIWFAQWLWKVSFTLI
jgi:hypothetical protein